MTIIEEKIKKIVYEEFSKLVQKELQDLNLEMKMFQQLLIQEI